MTYAGAKKAILPFIASIAALIIAWVATGDFDVLELRILGAGSITAVAVYAVPNIASTPFLKALVPSALAVVAVGTSALESGEFTVGDLQTAVAGLLTSGLVWWVKNEDITPAVIGQSGSTAATAIPLESGKTYFVGWGSGVQVFDRNSNEWSPFGEATTT